MRSSTGQHWIALDHVRALAAFSVFTWHFTHSWNGFPTPFEGAPALFPFAILDEGHTGVALFMALSGYLFAKLLDGKAVYYGRFFWNRAVRLLPLLLVVVVLVALDQMRVGTFNLADELHTLTWGWLLPILPNGGWSITVEAHFYLILPLLMWATRRWAFAPLAFLAAAIAVRCGLFLHFGEVQFLAYKTIVGHIDQFLLGIFAFQNRDLMRKRHVLAGAIALGFAGFYYVFDRLGGWYQMGGQPSQSPLWILIPTVEAIAFSALIAWYDTSFSFRTQGISGLIGKIGECSYSIYLLHFFVVFRLAKLIHTHVMDISNFYLACAWSALCFIAIAPFCWLSFAFFEKPIMDRFRVRYVKPAPSGTGAAALGTPQSQTTPNIV